MQQLFADDDAVAQWELELLPLRGMARLPVLLPLAWHLRQRDGKRARQLAQEAAELLPSAQLPEANRAQLEARLQLVDGEIRWLDGELEAGAALAARAQDVFTAQGDHAGRADAHWLKAWISVDRGNHAQRDAELEACSEAAHAADDEQRAAIADAVQARWAALRDLHAATERWGKRFNLEQDAPPGVECWINDFFAIAASQAGDIGNSAAFYIRSYEAALETGQIRAAATAATNIAEKFSQLNDHHSGLEWMQRAMELAKPTGWPRSIGSCLVHTADIVRRLGRLDAAEELLREALVILAPQANGRSYAIALQHLGDLCLDKKDFGEALDAFQRLSDRAEALQQGDFKIVALRGQAHALCYLNRSLEALDMAQLAVERAARHHNVFHHVAALRVLALIHGQLQLSSPPGMAAPNARLHYLHKALEAAQTIKGYTVPGDLYDALGAEYARLGDFSRAYAMSTAASAAREKTHTLEATSRAIAMQVHHQTEQARAEGMHHRELAMSEARRAEVLQQTSKLLERLSAIGQEITTHLDARAVFQALDRHTHALLSANTFAVYLVDASGSKLERAFGVEAGKALPRNAIAVDHATAYTAQCLRERREVYIGEIPPERDSLVTPGTAASRSALYVPLLVGERVLGVMTVQAMHANAYGERERLIFRTLCAYGAIALDNAHAYSQLQEAQSQLVSQEKLAALGSLMAGVAHELNTPIGNSLLIASTLEQKTNELEAAVKGPGLRKSELLAFIDDTRTASALVMRGLHSAADLVSSFKQVAVDRTTEQRRIFNLHQVTHEIVATVMNRIRKDCHLIDFDVPELVMLDSYPGPFGQVITNLINNSLLHAFDGREGGQMRLRATTPVEGRVLVAFSDDGSGIAPENLGRIFDPFFTTKLGHGGSGLGLSISYNIVTSLLGGQIAVASGSAGTTFTLDLPITAPSHDPERPATIY
ncbi:tetratricopeptide repeat-containing sensor histidine kinase [Pseudoduganella violaceinigra]|uniref:tetratricopeptide repeat-containing sensor histidine kinase n=1 Tax=Pseudoduganella violaceinigra TaxID=246602 RepID=UPI000411855A|nr:tetratricopeptide repeat-containing sensor histidine kinase [Pseudoduganella violaceinigra]